MQGFFSARFWSSTGVFKRRSLPFHHRHKHTYTHTCLWQAEVCGQPNNKQFSVNTVSRLPQTQEPCAAEILLTKPSLCVCLCVCCSSVLLMGIWKKYINMIHKVEQKQISLNTNFICQVSKQLFLRAQSEVCCCAFGLFACVVEIASFPFVIRSPRTVRCAWSHR